MPDPVVVPVTYGYKITVFPSEGDGKVNGRPRWWTATDAVAIEHVEASDTEEVAVLGFADGTSFTLLHHDGALYRPVFAPGTHEPCDVEALEAACRGDVAWLDSPFEPGLGSRNDNKLPKPVNHDRDKTDRRTYRKVSDSEHELARARVVATAGRMLVVDGVVHVACATPTLVLKAPVTLPGKRPEALRLEWSLPGLESDDDAERGPTTVELPHDHYGAVRHHKGPAPIEGPRIRWQARPWRTFGLADLVTARAFGEAAAEAQGLRFEEREGLATVVRDWRLGALPEVPMQRYAKEAFDQVDLKVASLSRASVLDWLDARDALAAGDSVRALDCLASVLDRPDDRSRLPLDALSNLIQENHYAIGGGNARRNDGERADAVMNLLRFVLVERRRAYAVTPDEIDAEAMAGIEMHDLDGPAPGMGR